MKEEKSLETRMRETTRTTIKEYLLEEIYNEKTIKEAISERIWEDFGDELVNKLADPIWNDTVAEVESEVQEARDFCRSREMDLADAREGRW